MESIFWQLVTRTKKYQTEDKWNQLNLMDIQFLLGTNHYLPLSHMAKSYICIEEKNQRINELSIVYITNEKAHEYDEYPSDTDGCAINLDDEHKNE